MDQPWAGDANGWVTVLRHASAAGLLTNLELASIPPERIRALTVPCLPELDYLVVNDTEIGAIAGLSTVQDDTTDIEACTAAARAVLAQGVRRLVVVHFPQGAVAVTADGTVTYRPSVRVPPSAIVAANGAGDAFAAGLLYGLHESWPVDRALSPGPRGGGGLAQEHVDDGCGGELAGLPGAGGRVGVAIGGAVTSGPSPRSIGRSSASRG